MTAHADAQPQSSLMEGQHFLMRRLHSLTGIAPIGLFLIMHLTTNSSIVWGKLSDRAGSHGHGGVETFQHEVDFINNLPGIFLLELFGLWLPIAFHSILGCYYAMSGKSNTRRYGYAANWRYKLQRISGYVGVLFVFYHVATLRWGWSWLPGYQEWGAKNAASTLAEVLRGGSEGITPTGIAVSTFYMVSVTLLVFHFANGLWTAAITWGLTVSAKAQRKWGYACAGIGLGLTVLGWSSVIGFLMLDPAEAREVETRYHEASTDGAGGH